MDLKNFKFTYDNKKESFTPEEVSKLLSDQKQAINGYAVNEYKPLTEELATLKQAKKETTIQQIASEINAKEAEKLVKYTKFEKDASPEAIKLAFMATNEDLFPKQPTPDTTSIKKVVEEVKKPEKIVVENETISATAKWRNT